MPSSLPPPEAKATAVREMFDRIAPRYDRLNRILTIGADRRWRRALIGRLGVLEGDRVLDLACGTGDFSQLARERGAATIALDFAPTMLRIARRRVPAAAVVCADALRLPLRDESVTVVVSGFALRNFSALPPVFEEAARVLGRGGRLGLLEVDRPASGLVRLAHSLYFHQIVPRLGGWLAADRKAYRYLPESAVYMPAPAALAGMLRAAGFHQIVKRRHMLGAIQTITAVRR